MCSFKTGLISVLSSEEQEKNKGGGGCVCSKNKKVLQEDTKVTFYQFRSPSCPDEILYLLHYRKTTLRTERVR